MNGFSLHAALSTGADKRQAVEQLCQHIVRLPLANTRAQFGDIRQVVLKLKAPGAMARRT